MPRGECGFEFNANKKKNNKHMQLLGLRIQHNIRFALAGHHEKRDEDAEHFFAWISGTNSRRGCPPVLRSDLQNRPYGLLMFFFTNNSFNTAALWKKGAPSSVMIVNWMVSPSFIYLNLDIKPQCECS